MSLIFLTNDKICPIKNIGKWNYRLKLVDTIGVLELMHLNSFFKCINKINLKNKIKLKFLLQ